MEIRLEEIMVRDSLMSKRISIEELDRKISKLNFTTPGDSVEIIRHDRDTR